MSSEQNAPESDTSFRQALITMMGSQLGTLQSIKAGELQWLERYTILVSLAIGFFLLSDPAKTNSAAFTWSLLLIFLVITMFFQIILMKERRSYYRVLRSVVRAQKFLGFFQYKFLAEHFANSAFPKGLGPNKEKDGTQRYSSFLSRQLYIFFSFLILIVSAMHHNVDLKWCLVLLLLLFDLLCIVIIYVWDWLKISAETRSEKGLLGADPTWFEEHGKTGSG